VRLLVLLKKKNYDVNSRCSRFCKHAKTSPQTSEHMALAATNEPGTIRIPPTGQRISIVGLLIIAGKWERARSGDATYSFVFLFGSSVTHHKEGGGPNKGTAHCT